MGSVPGVGRSAVSAVVCAGLFAGWAAFFAVRAVSSETPARWWLLTATMVVGLVVAVISAAERRRSARRS